MEDLVLCVCGRKPHLYYVCLPDRHWVECKCGWQGKEEKSEAEAVVSWNAVMSAARAVRYGHCPGCTDPRSEGTHCEGTWEHPEVPR